MIKKKKNGVQQMYNLNHCNLASVNIQFCDLTKWHKKNKIKIGVQQMYNLNHGMVLEYTLLPVRNSPPNIISSSLSGWEVKVMFDLKFWKLFI